MLDLVLSNEKCENKKKPSSRLSQIMIIMLLKAMRCILKFCDVPTLENGLERIGEGQNF